MLEVLFEQCCQRAPDTPAYRQAMADILTAEEARERLSEYYLAAKRGMDAYTGEHEPDSFLAIIRNVLAERAADLCRQLVCFRSDATGSIVDEITTRFNPDRVIVDLKEASADLKARYALGGLGVYLPLVWYEVCDPSECEEGLMWLVAKAFFRYGYDLLDAIQVSFSNICPFGGHRVLSHRRQSRGRMSRKKQRSGDHGRMWFPLRCHLEHLVLV